MNKHNFKLINPNLFRNKLVISSLAFITVFVLLLIGCKKDDQSLTTALKIRVITEEGASVSGATVKLFKTVSDLENQTNQYGTTQTTDAGGEVTFNDLEAIKYYWFAETGCKNNINGIATTDAMQTGEVRIVTSTLMETGTLELTNQSVYQYNVYINGSLLFTADAKYTYSYLYVPTGSYSISVTILGGSTSKTYPTTITCGNKTTVTFP
jgi:hypothetical protein